MTLAESVRQGAAKRQEIKNRLHHARTVIFMDTLNNMRGKNAARQLNLPRGAQAAVYFR